MRITILTISDRASRGEYEDLGGPAIERWLRRTVTSSLDITRKTISDGFETVRDELIEQCDQERVDMVLTTGGTGPSPRDLTPEAMRAVLVKEFPGFGELMRRSSLDQVPTAILSRQTAGTRGKTLIVNLPGAPSSIEVCLSTVFPAIPYCLQLIGAGHMETDPTILKAHWPGR